MLPNVVDNHDAKKEGKKFYLVTVTNEESSFSEPSKVGPRVKISQLSGAKGAFAEARQCLRVELV